MENIATKVRQEDEQIDAHTSLRQYFSTRSWLIDWLYGSLRSKDPATLIYFGQYDDTSGQGMRDLIQAGLQLIEDGQILVVTNSLLPQIDDDLEENRTPFNDQVAMGAMNHGFSLGRTLDESPVGPSPVVYLNTKRFAQYNQDGTECQVELNTKDTADLLDAVAGATVEYIFASPKARETFVTESDFTTAVFKRKFAV